MSDATVKVAVPFVEPERIRQLAAQAWAQGTTDATPQEIAFALGKLGHLQDEYAKLRDEVEQLRMIDADVRERAKLAARVHLEEVMAPILEKLETWMKPVPLSSKQKEDLASERETDVRFRMRVALVAELLGRVEPLSGASAKAVVRQTLDWADIIIEEARKP